MATRADAYRDRLLERYAIGQQVAQLRDDRWKGETFHAGETGRITRNHTEIEKLIPKHGFSRAEQLHECYRLYRTWSPDRFRTLVNLKRTNGTALFSLGVLLDLQTQELDPAKRRHLEERLIATQMPSPEFRAKIRQTLTQQDQVAPRKVSDPAIAFERFVKNLSVFLPHFDLIEQGRDLLKDPARPLTPRQQKEVVRCLETAQRGLSELREKTAAAMKVVASRLRSVLGRVPQSTR